MKNIVIYTTRYCGFCNQAKMLLNRLNLPFQDIPVDNDPELRRKVSAENGNFPTVPMILVDNEFVGGYTELVQYYKSGKLE